MDDSSDASSDTCSDTDTDQEDQRDPNEKFEFIQLSENGRKRKKLRRIIGGEWQYHNTRRDGKIQVFGNFPVAPNEASLDNITTRSIGVAPHIIDPEPTLGDIQQLRAEFHEKEESRKQNNLEAAEIRRRSRDRSPSHLLYGGRWRYDLKSGRKQVFYNNPQVLMQPGRRRASFGDSDSYNTRFPYDVHRPYDYLPRAKRPAWEIRNRPKNRWGPDAGLPVRSRV